MPLQDDDFRSDKIKDMKIDFDFYDSITENDVNDPENEECNLGVKKVQIKPQEKPSNTEVTVENDSQKDIYINNSDCDLDGSVTKCIAYETNGEIDSFEERYSGLSDGDASPVLGSSLSESTQSSELTNVTPLTSSSSYSSLNKEKLDDDSCSLNSSKDEMKLLADAVETLSLQNKSRRRSSIPVSTSRLAGRPKRKNMTFTNEELRKIDRENDILLKKIMSYSKPTPKNNVFNNKNPPRTVKASAAVNRSKKQREIDRENYILLKKIQSAKPTQSYNNVR